MTEDERTEQAIQFHTDLALQQHQAIQTIQSSATHCGECGNDIPLARQQAIPGVRLCIECKHAEEKRERTT